MADCCEQFGGRISIEIGDDRFAPTEADIELLPTNVEVDGEANQDGSACYKVKPKLYEADIKLRQPCGIKWDAKMRVCKVNATIVEIDNGRTHLFTGARIVGRPSVNLSTGEVTGLKIMGPAYQSVGV
jgi:hypothetical protein